MPLLGLAIRRRSPWFILGIGGVAMALLVWGMRTAVEQAVPVAPLIDLAKALRDLYSFEQVAVTRVPPVGDPAVLKITCRAGRGSRPFASTQAEMADVAAYVRSQYGRFAGDWTGINRIEIERTGADDQTARYGRELWKQVWAAMPMSADAAGKMNRWVQEGNQRWRLDSLEVARVGLVTWLSDSRRVQTPSPEMNQAMIRGWEPAFNSDRKHVWLWKGLGWEYRVTVRATPGAGGKPGIFTAERIEEAVAEPVEAR